MSHSLGVYFLCLCMVSSIFFFLCVVYVIANYIIVFFFPGGFYVWFKWRKYRVCSWIQKCDSLPGAFISYGFVIFFLYIIYIIANYITGFFSLENFTFRSGEENMSKSSWIQKSRSYNCDSFPERLYLYDFICLVKFYFPFLFLCIIANYTGRFFPI